MFFNIVSMFFLSCFPEFFHILPFPFLLSSCWDQDLAENPNSQFYIPWFLSTALSSLHGVCQHLLTAVGKGDLSEAVVTKENGSDAWYNL